MHAIDLHTHSYASPDGGLTPDDYRRMLEHGPLQTVAVTDHNTIAAAQTLQAALGGRIIIGEEISTQEGDIIGLYLREAVPAGLPAADAARMIKAQGGLVYVPHPFDRLRASLGGRLLAALEGMIDIAETYNGRMLTRGSNLRAAQWAALHRIPGAASSDAHGWHGWGRTYTVLRQAPTAGTLPGLLAAGTCTVARPLVRAMMYPKYNRARKYFVRGK